MKLRKQLVTARNRFVGSGTNARKYLTIHETANHGRGANAAAHANLQSRGYRAASWHYTVDDKEAVQSYEDSAICWHAGDGAGNGNKASIAIEICVNADGNNAVSRANAAKLAARILKRNGIPLSNMVQHNHWSGKNCPAIIRGNGLWGGFKAQVQAELNALNGKPTATVPQTLVVDQYWGKATTRKAQKVYGTPVDGEVSSQSAYWRSRYSSRFTSGWEWAAKPKGSQLIVAMQTHFKKNGHKITKIDGLIGPEFVAAFTAYMGGKTLAEAVGNFQLRLNKGRK